MPNNKNTTIALTCSAREVSSPMSSGSPGVKMPAMLKAEHGVPAITIEYMYMNDGEEESDRNPIIAMVDRRSELIFTNQVFAKGASSYAVKRVSNDLQSLGYRKFMLKSESSSCLIHV